MSSGSAKSSSCSVSGGPSMAGTTSSRIGLARLRSAAGSGPGRSRRRPRAARRSKSVIVTARAPGRSDSGPRRLAFSTVSASTPPVAGSRFSTLDTYGIADRSPVSVPAPTLPVGAAAACGTGWRRSGRPRAGSRRAGASSRRGSGSSGPKRTSPVVESQTKWRSSRPGLEKSATSVHSLAAGASASVPPPPRPRLALARAAAPASRADRERPGRACPCCARAPRVRRLAVLGRHRAADAGGA